MKNVFARTVLALVLIPSFWMTSVGMAAAGDWVDTPGETVGKMVNPSGEGIRVSMTLFGYWNACQKESERMPGGGRDDPEGPPSGIRYMQFVPDYSGALGGLCYYYEAGSSFGETGEYTWRWDE